MEKLCWRAKEDPAPLVHILEVVPVALSLGLKRN